MSAQKKIPCRYLLISTNHPTFQKLEKVLELLDQLGLTIYFGPTSTILTDENIPGINFLIRDLESEKPIYSLPPSVEYKIIRDNPEHKLYLEEKNKNERLKREEKEHQDKLAKEEKERREETERKEQEEISDKKQFETLKQKWEW
jgi:septum formation inhibitor MinC